MSSSDFTKVLVKDDRLAGITDSLKYAVLKGASNMTAQTFNAISKSPNSLTFNVTVPSESVVIDRRVLLRTTFTIKVTGTCEQKDQLLVQYGSTEALAPFPLLQSCNTISATINNNTVNLNAQDVINAIMRSNDKRELYAYNSMCPVMADAYQKYSDGVGGNNNPLGAFNNSADPDIVYRGAFAPDSITGNTPSADPPVEQNVFIKVTTVEPVLVSPFIFADPHNQTGIYGVTNMNFVFNLTGQANRSFRSSRSAITSATISSVDSAELLFNFLTPQSSDLLPSRNVVPLTFV